MESRAAILLIDDGELDDVRSILETLGADFSWMRAKDARDEIELPEALFVTTAGLGVSLRYGRQTSMKAERPTRIAVATGTSRTQRGALKRAGFDFLVHRPVHPTALRLLIVHALYRGREKRASKRFAFGYDVLYRARLRKRPATLVELASNGCRIVVAEPLEPEARLVLQIPAEVAGGRPLDLKARVVRRDDQDDGREFSVGLRFENLTEATRNQLRVILTDRFWGPAMLPRDPATGPRRTGEPRPAQPARTDPRTPTSEPPLPVPKEEAERSEEAAAPVADPTAGTGEANAASEDQEGRRRNPRFVYGGEVIAMARAVSRVLVGRDLSCEGMRVEAHSQLQVGDRIRLALYATRRKEPFLVAASVMRDDGDAGLALRFEDRDPATDEKIEDLMQGLPRIESIGKKDGGTVILSEVVPDD